MTSRFPYFPYGFSFALRRALQSPAREGTKDGLDAVGGHVGQAGAFILGDFFFSLPKTTVYSQCDNYRLGIWPTYPSLAVPACPSSPSGLCHTPSGWNLPTSYPSCSSQKPCPHRTHSGLPHFLKSSAPACNLWFRCLE